MPWNHEQFMMFAARFSEECHAIFDDRKEAYSKLGDRLSQFFDLENEQGKPAPMVLLDMAAKHWNMCKNLADRESVDLELWDRCTKDLHNYMILLAAVVRDERYQSMAAGEPRKPNVVKMMEDAKDDT